MVSGTFGFYVDLIVDIFFIGEFEDDHDRVCVRQWLSAEFIQAFCIRAKPLFATKAQAIVMEGQHGTEMYFVLSGTKHADLLHLMRFCSVVYRIICSPALLLFVWDMLPHYRSKSDMLCPAVLCRRRG